MKKTLNSCRSIVKSSMAYQNRDIDAMGKNGKRLTNISDWVYPLSVDNL